LLVEQFLEHDPLARRLGVTRAADDVIAELQDHPWPGNVRELHNVLRRSIAQHADGAVLGKVHCAADVIPQEVATPEAIAAMSARSGDRSPFGSFRAWMQEREREYLRGLIEHHRSVTQQAAASGLPERTLYRKLRGLGLQPPRRSAVASRSRARVSPERPCFVVAPNAGLTTGWGTSQYVVGEGDVVLVDVAPLTS
jgi:DNA-binding NtrC family response regulator